LKKRPVHCLRTSRIQKGRHRLTTALRPLAHSFSGPTPWTKCTVLLTQISSVSPGSIKWWARCPSL